MSEFSDAKLIILPNEGAKAGTMYVVKPTDGTSDGVMDRNGTKKRVNKDGLIETMAANLLLPDYTGGGCGVIKPEPQSTNLLRRSQEFNVTWSKRGSPVTSVNSETAPDDTVTADELTLTGSGVNDIFQLVSTFQNSVNISPSIYIKKISLSGVVALDNPSGSGFGKWDVDLSLLGGEFERITKDHVSVTETTVFMSTGTGSGGTHLFSRTGASLNFYVWGAQNENGLSPTSYIKTEGTTVTRLKDNTSFPVPAGVTEIIETINDVEQAPITVIPVNYELPEANINKVIMN